MLNRRFKQHQQIIWQDKGGIQDRTIYEDSVFAKMLRDQGLMEERDYQTYISLFKNMSNFMARNNLIVHLDVSPKESLERLRMRYVVICKNWLLWRNRSCEVGVSLEYLTALHKEYESFIQQISKTIPVLRVNWKEFKTPQEMAKLIKQEYQKMQNIRIVDFQ